MTADLPEFDDAHGSGAPQSTSSAVGFEGGEAALSALADDHLAAALMQSGFDVVGGFEHVLDQLTIATDLFDVSTVHQPDGHSDT
jgi:hypothetical protein